MSDCLGQLSFTTERETMTRNLPKCFKPDYEDVIDCTELYIEKPSQVIQQSATWSEYKGHNTGKVLIAMSPLMLPVFASDIYLGVASDIYPRVAIFFRTADSWLSVWSLSCRFPVKLVVSALHDCFHITIH